jgi:hypothetical protein
MPDYLPNTALADGVSVDVPDTNRILVWFSCGAASAVAAQLTLTLFPERDVRIVCCDTRPSEHEDNYRFAKDVERWIKRPIEFIRNSAFDTVDDVFEHTRYMSGPDGARCTKELKKVPRLWYAGANDHHVFGYTANEGGRLRRFTKRNPALKLINILFDRGVTKSDCLRVIADAGIELPKMYRLGFDNNNCPGCVKASSPWYWHHVRTHFPEVFQRRCQQSRALGVRLIQATNECIARLAPGVKPEGKKRRLFLDELPAGPFKKNRKKENLSCGPECGGKN